MGYHLNAILGEYKRLQAVASAMPPAVIVPLAGELGLIPLSEELFDAVNQNSTENYEEAKPQMFTRLSARIASWLKSLSADEIIAYIEAEYFGGAGDQCAVAWRDEIEVLPPTKGKDSINQALRLLGVRAESGKDEFDTVWLGRHRTMEGWVDEGTARQRAALAPKTEFDYPPFGEAVESFRRFLRDQGCSDKIRWLWREDICTRRAPGSRRTWNRSVFINLAGPSDKSLVERYYKYGVNHNLGIVLEVFCLAAGYSCCFVYVPEDETDAEHRMIGGLKLNVPTQPVIARGVSNSWSWAILRLLVGTPNNSWIQDLPRRSDAEWASQCGTCGHPNRVLWGCGSFPQLPDVDKGNYVILQRCEQCGALWCMSPYEPYLSFTFLAAWPYGQHEWRIVHDVDNGNTLLEWHAAMIREHWQELPDDERQHVERWRKRSYGHNPIDRLPLTTHPVPLQNSSEMEAIVRAISEK